MKFKVGIIGASGRMGTEIIKLLQSSTKLEPYLAVHRGSKPTSCKVEQTHYQGPAILDVDLWIDFSLSDNFENIYKLIERTQKPIISGTTGLNDDQLRRLKVLGEKTAILWSSNMSLGITLLHRMIESLASIQNFDFQIEEIHHNKKIDKPSGTAKTLQRRLISVLKREIPDPVSIRGGGVFGDHRVLALSDDEVISIEHRALNRTIFAKGAVAAAEWIIDKGPGNYSMEDVLFL